MCEHLWLPYEYIKFRETESDPNNSIYDLAQENRRLYVGG